MFILLLFDIHLNILNKYLKIGIHEVVTIAKNTIDSTEINKGIIGDITK